MRRCRAFRRRGFTLIELLLVVAIIGALAAIAIPNFLRYQLKAKSSEGKTNLAAIRTAQIGYFAEFGAYASADVSPNLASDNQKHPFSASPGFQELGWRADGSVFFTYGVETSIDGRQFHATAHGNIDNDGQAQIWHYRTGDVDSQDHLGAAPVSCAGNVGRPLVVEPCDAASGTNAF